MGIDMDKRMDEADRGLYERIYLVVQQVPRGMVSTYGDIAAIVGCGARTVGYALNEIPKGREGAVPWQRIINREGGISTRGARQRELLEAEGVEFDARDRAILARFRWPGPSADWAAAHGFGGLPRPRQAPDAGAQDEQDEQDGQLRLF